MQVIKRDGKVESFNIEKIRLAVQSAMKEAGCSETDCRDAIYPIAHKVYTKIGNREEIHVEEIQDLVEFELMKSRFKDVAQEYIRYRNSRTEARNLQQNLDKKIGELIARKESVVNENANKDSNIFNTQRDLLAGITAKDYALRYLLPKDIVEAHEKGEIHFHDMDYSPFTPYTNCMLIDFKGMLSKGFTIGNAEVESPKSIQTATAQMAQIIANVASSQYGGCTSDRTDEVLAPYAMRNYEKHLEVAKRWIDDPYDRELYAKERTIKDIHDAMQSLEYEINTLYSANGQTPFTSLGFGLGTNWIEREIQKAILQVRIDGIGTEKRTAIFPKLIFTLKRGHNLDPQDPNYDIKQMALDCATKRMYPDILMYDKLIEITGSFKASMGCRSFLHKWVDENGEEVHSGRQNLGVVTINLPRIAIESEGCTITFWNILRERLDVARKALEVRIESLKRARAGNAPILYQYGATGARLEADDSVMQLFENKRASVSLGYIGLYEVGTIFYGSEWETNAEAKEFTLDVLRLMKEATTKWTEETGYYFSIYSTPSESLTDRFCRLDTAEFGVIKDVTDKAYYTNSFHYDVRKNPTPFEKIDFEMDYPHLASGGFIHYVEYPNLKHNPKALEMVWDYAYDRIGYLGQNIPIDHCYECGYSGEFEPTEKGFKCPSCGNTNPKTCDVVKRTCGYLGNPQARPMVKGRHKEISARVKHM